ncbi:MAG: GntR family transcriptional regulator [Planctomycetes bacterium]|nr:GntR family transcriptional regulator [Planctomycetota bacterium]
MASILFSVNPGDGLPIYRQIVEQVKGAVSAGRLKPGDQLPTHRELAGELVVAPLTVKKAYDLLQAEGLITMEQGRGTFVTGRARAGSAGARLELIVRVEGLVRQAQVMGLSGAELLRLIRGRWRKALVGGRHG